MSFGVVVSLEVGELSLVDLLANLAHIYWNWFRICSAVDESSLIDELIE